MSEGLLPWLFNWSIQKIGKQTLLTWILLLGILAPLVYGLSNIVRQLDSNLLWTISFLGLICGWYFARSRLSGIQAGFLIVALGIVIISGIIGDLGGRLLLLPQALNQLANQVLHWRPDLPLPDITPSVMIIADLATRTGTLLLRNSEWLLGLATGRSNFDPVATSMVWCLGIWLAVGFAGWIIRRHDQPLLGLIPVTALLVSSLAFVRASPALVLLLLAAILFLMAKIDYTVRERSWQSRSIDYSEEIRFDLAVVVILVVISLTTVAAFSPALSIRHILDFANRLTEHQASSTLPAARPSGAQPQPNQDRKDSESFAKSLGLERRPTPVPENVLSQSRITGLPTEHLLGSGPELSKEVIMVISTGDIPPGPAQGLVNQKIPRYYWRGLTYDRYTGSGWATGPGESIQYQAGELAQVPSLSAQRLVKQHVEFTDLGYQGGLLYAAGELVRVDKNYEVSWRLAPQVPHPDSETGINEPYSDIYGAIVPYTSYTAESLVPQPGVDQLRESGSDYPEWIRNHYLNLPESVPARVLRLAQDLTATEKTPYDRSLAIEAYLRKFPYTLDLPTPPSNRDMADYFLFDLKKGYCDYYATAMVVLSRAAGIPARLAIGYASGTYDAERARYIVTAADAHSWPEIYFPGYGWIGFEPTAGQPVLNRPAEAASLEVPELDSHLANVENAQPLTWQQILSRIAGLIGSLILTIILWLSIESWWLSRLSPSAAITGIYARLYRQARYLDVIVQRGDTPSEFSASLLRHLDERKKNQFIDHFLIPAGTEMHRLTIFYSRTTYSQHAPDAADQQNAIQLWQRLRRRLWLATLARKFP